MVSLRSPSPRRAVFAHASAAVIARFRPWCCSVSRAKMPSVKKIAVMHALAVTVPSAWMIFRRKGKIYRYSLRLIAKEKRKRVTIYIGNLCPYILLLRSILSFVTCWICLDLSYFQQKKTNPLYSGYGWMCSISNRSEQIPLAYPRFNRSLQEWVRVRGSLSGSFLDL